MDQEVRLGGDYGRLAEGAIIEKGMNDFSPMMTGHDASPEVGANVYKLLRVSPTDLAFSKQTDKLAEIIAGVVLAGELSLGAAISSLEWVSSHEEYGRNR